MYPMSYGEGCAQLFFTLFLAACTICIAAGTAYALFVEGDYGAAFIGALATVGAAGATSGTARGL